MRRAIFSAVMLWVGVADGQSTLRVWGSPQMGGVLRLWEQNFAKHRPDIRFANELHGTASGIAGLYTGVADIAVMGREIWPSETLAYESVFARKPLEIEVATGSYDTPKVTFALVLYVHESNPLSKLTLDQVAAIFGQPRTAGVVAIRSWNQLGLRAEWAGRPIHTYNFDYENDKSVFFRRRVLGDRYRWDNRTREFSNIANDDGETQDAGKLILDALAKDALGIAVSNPHYANAVVKPVALDVAGKSIAASPETVRKRTYPLARAVYIYTNRDPSKTLDANVGAFLSYVLSEEGQKDVAADGSYLPLTSEGVLAGRRVIDEK